MKIGKRNKWFIKIYLNSEVKIKRIKHPKNMMKIITISYNLSDNAKIEKKIKSMAYVEFLQTVYWKIISAMVKREADYMCNRCGSEKDLHVHHKAYEHHGKELEYWKQDLECLCAVCHEKEHNIKRFSTTEKSLRGEK